MAQPCAHVAVNVSMQGMLDAARGSLMVYLGAPNADSYAVSSQLLTTRLSDAAQQVSPGGYLNMLKFSDLDSIGEFLGKVHGDSSLYPAHCRWETAGQECVVVSFLLQLAVLLRAPFAAHL